MLPRAPLIAALAVALTTPTIYRGPRAASRRAFRHAGALPEQPAGVEVLAVVARARAQAGREHAWDARLEASLLAVHGYLWRRGRGEKWAGTQGSSRYGCSIAQLVMGLAPIMGWKGIPDPRDHPGRRRFVKRHRKSVQRWLSWLELAGLIAHTPQQDEEGFWWRTIVELYAAPELDPETFSAARRRRLGWRAAEERRRARGRQRDLTAILRRARLTRAQRRARAYQRRRELRECQERSRVRELLTRSLADAASEHLTHPYGASTTCRELPQAISPLQTSLRGHTRTRALISDPTATTAANNNSTAKRPPVVGEAQRWAIYREVVGVRYSRTDEEWAPITESIKRRVGELSKWPLGWASPPRWRLVEAWALACHGVGMAAAGGARLAMWSEPRPHHGARLDRALVRYARFSQARPPGFPQSPVAGFAHLLCHHTPVQEGAERAMAYDVARFNELTKQMSAYAHITHAQNVARAAARARRRAARVIAEQTNQQLSLRFRLAGSAHVQLARDLLESDHPAHQATGRRLYAAQQRHQTAQERERRVLDGKDPWPYDGRYRAAVRHAERWGLPTPAWEQAAKFALQARGRLGTGNDRDLGPVSEQARQVPELTPKPDRRRDRGRGFGM